MSKRRQLRWLLLPIDIKTRELKGKLFLAAVAAKSGWGVIISSKAGIKRISAIWPRSMILEINTSPGYESHFDHHLRSGHRVTAWHEEGLVYLNLDDYRERKVDIKIIRKLDYLFLWGDRQRSDTCSLFPEYQEKLVSVGNPRFDLLRPELRGIFASDARKLTTEIGDFILVNTNFGRANHFRGIATVIPDLISKGIIRSKSEEDRQVRWLRYQEKLFFEFKAAVRQVSLCHPDLMVVVRPHPSENIFSWKEATKDLENVLVANAGDVTPWLMSAKAVIHNSCTTAVQTFLLNKIPISFMPISSNEFDAYLPNTLSHRVHTLSELKMALEAAINDSKWNVADTNTDTLQLADQHITGRDGFFASQRIISLLDGIDLAQVLAPDLQDKALAARVWDRISDTLFRSAKQTPNENNFESEIQAARSVKAYGEHKFPGISRLEVEQFMKKIFIATSAQYGEVSVDELSKNIIRISPK